jgi:hypothetical protein
MNILRVCWICRRSKLPTIEDGPDGFDKGFATDGATIAMLFKMQKLQNDWVGECVLAVVESATATERAAQIHWLKSLQFAIRSNPWNLA